MAHLTPDQFSAKWIPLLANNVFQDIDGVRLGLLITDIKDSFGAASTAVNVPDWVKGTYYPLGYLILHSFGGPAIFLQATQAGYLPAPTDPLGDASWTPALGPVVAGTYQVGTVVALQGLQGDWVPGRLYILRNRVDGNNVALPDVYVRALSAHTLEPQGYTLDALGTPPAPVRVQYDLDTDTTQLVSGGEPAITILNSNQRYTFDTLAAAAASGQAAYSKLTISAPVPAAQAQFSSVASINGNGNTLAGLSTAAPLRVSGSSASNTAFVLAELTFDSLFNCQFSTCTLNGRLINCLLQAGNKFNGQVSLEGSTAVPAGFFTAYVKNQDGTYTTPEGGTITDRRPGSSYPDLLAQLGAVATTLPLTAVRSADYTLGLADAGCLVPVSAAGAVALTLPAHADVALVVGSTGYVRRMGAGAVTLVPGANVQFLPAGVGTSLSAYGECSFHKIDLNTYWLKGDLL